LLVNETKFVRLTQINEQGLMEAEEASQEILVHS